MQAGDKLCLDGSVAPSCHQPLGVEREQQGRQDGVSASVNVGNCFVIPFSEPGAVSCAEWMEIALAQFGGDVEIS